MEYILIIAIIGVIWSVISWWKKKTESDRIESAQIAQERNYPAKLAFNNNIIQLLHEQENYSVAILTIPGPKNWSEDDRYQRIEDFKFEQIEKIDRLIRSIPDPFEFDEPLTQHHYSHKHSVENQVKSIFESTIRKIYDLNNKFIEENVRIHTNLLDLLQKSAESSVFRLGASASLSGPLFRTGRTPPRCSPAQR